MPFVRVCWFVVCCSLFVTCCLCCSLVGVFCAMMFVCCVLFDVSCSSCVVRGLLCVCLLFVFVARLKVFACLLLLVCVVSGSLFDLC